MNRHESESNEAPFWQLDEELGELELQERPGGPDVYTVRLKARRATSPYHANRELYPLADNGTQHEVSGKAYILVPDITVTVGLFAHQRPSGAIGTVTDSQWQGMRHHDIANVRGWYYEQDRSLGLWEVDPWGRLDEFAHGRLWQLFEGFLLRQFPNTQQLFIDDGAGPGENTVHNRESLAHLGYTPVAGTQRIFAKEVAR